MRIGLAQTWDAGSYEQNVQQALEKLERAHRAGIKVICFPEIQFTPFFPLTPGIKLPFGFAEAVPGSTVELFQEKARDYGMVIVISLYERFDGEYYSAAAVIDADGSLLGVSRKVHALKTRKLHEQDYYTPSDRNFRVYHTTFGRIGILLGSDFHFPEAARILAIHDAEIILIPGALFEEERNGVFEAELMAMAFQNGVYVGLINRVGRENGIKFTGGSLWIDPEGKILCRGNDQTAIVECTADLDVLQRTKDEYGFLKSRRPDEYFNIIRVSVD